MHLVSCENAYLFIFQFLIITCLDSNNIWKVLQKRGVNKNSIEALKHITREIEIF